MGLLMLYEFLCGHCGKFDVRQSLDSEHKADCPQCGGPGQRIYSSFQWMWANSVFRKDGSYRQDSDYDILKG